jgi:hypothetical protein
MSENEGKPKKPTSVDVLSQAPRRDSYDKEEHGSGNPHLQPGELQTSETWKSHKPHKSAKPKKP